MAFALLALSSNALALDTQADAHAEAGGGYDSNAGHDLDGQAQGDGVALGVLQLDGALLPESAPLTVSGNYDLGAKKFFSLSEDDVVAQSANASALAQVGDLGLGLTARGKDRRSRSGDRDYTDLLGGAEGASRISKVVVHLELDGERFIYRPDSSFSFQGGNLALSAAVPLPSRMRLLFSANGSLRTYDRASVDANGLIRRDKVGGLGIDWRYKGPFIAEAGYDFLDDRANQFGKSSLRHRLSASGAIFLPGEIALALTAAVQRTRFPDGLALAPQVLLATDDEDTNSLTLGLSRVFPHGLSIQFKAAGYQADYATNGLAYHRATAQLTLGWDD